MIFNKFIENITFTCLISIHLKYETKVNYTKRYYLYTYIDNILRIKFVLV